MANVLKIEYLKNCDGQGYAAGDVADVPRSAARWAIVNGYAVAVNVAPKAKAKAKPAKKKAKPGNV